MADKNDKNDRKMLEEWEEEVLFGHRWGSHGVDVANKELARLKKLWEKAQQLDDNCKRIIYQIRALEICNWNLEDSILALCSAVGAKELAKLAIGHFDSITPERWKNVWAYYLTLKNYLGREIELSGHDVILKFCDPDGAVQNHILDMLGEKSELKELYVERFSLCLGFWLGGYFSEGSVQMRSHSSAASAIEEEIRKKDPDGKILNVMEDEGNGRLQPCNHKAFRRYDMIISSIGALRWRAVMPLRGTDGFERAETLDRYLGPIEVWIEGGGVKKEEREGGLYDEIGSLLGERDDTKVFLASFLVSILRAQQLSAIKRAESRVKG